MSGDADLQLGDEGPGGDPLDRMVCALSDLAGQSRLTLDPQTKYPQLRDPVWMREQLEAGVDVAAELGCSKPLVEFWISTLGLVGVRKHPLGRTYESYDGVRHPRLSDPAWWNGKDGMTATQIAHLAGASYPTVRKWIARHGFQERFGAAARDHRLSEERYRRLGNKKGGPGPGRPLAQKGPAWVLQQLVNGRTQSSIADELGVGKAAVSKYVKRQGLTP